MAVTARFLCDAGTDSPCGPCSVEPRRRGTYVRLTDDSSGLEAFSRYLHRHRRSKRAHPGRCYRRRIFCGEHPATLPGRDRNALLERRLSRKYSRTPFRLANAHRGAPLDNGEQRVVYCAVSNDELLTPWLAAIESARVPLAGITSVPLLVSRVWRSTAELKGKTLFISQHQRTKLRLVYFRDGELTSARLSRVPSIDAEDHTEQVVAEVQKSRRYLERARLLRPGEQLSACFLSDQEAVQKIARHNKDEALRLKSVDPRSIAKAMRMTSLPTADRLEALYIFAAAQSRRGQDYAPASATRHHRLHRIRRTAVAALVVGTLAAALATGLKFSNSLQLGRAVAGMREQTERMELTFQREHEEFSSTQAESKEIKAAVDASDFILANRVPVDLVLRELGAVLGDFPQLYIAGVDWRVDGYSDAAPTTAARTRAELQPVNGLTAELYGEVRPYEGNLHRAFGVVERLVAELASRSRFTDVQAIEYPLNVSPQASVAGELVGAGSARAAPFRLRLTDGAR